MGCGSQRIRLVGSAAASLCLSDRLLKELAELRRGMMDEGSRRIIAVGRRGGLPGDPAKAREHADVGPPSLRSGEALHRIVSVYGGHDPGVLRRMPYALGPNGCSDTREGPSLANAAEFLVLA